jgi:hypothetical protein
MEAKDIHKEMLPIWALLCGITAWSSEDIPGEHQVSTLK